MNTMKAQEMNMINAKEANFNSKKAKDEKFTNELNDINNLIKSASNDGDYCLEYNCGLCSNELNILLELLNNLGYDVKVTKDLFVNKLEITWFDSNLN